MLNRAKQRGWRRNLREVLKARRDNRGYTLQTIIVMSILIAAAAGASVVLLRAVSSNTDARSFTDTSGTNVPSRPHSFVVEKTLARVGGRTISPTVPSATVRWSPPLYTGFTRFEPTPGEGEQPVDASSASLLYEVEYGCGIPGQGEVPSLLSDLEFGNFDRNPTDDTATADIDESELGLHTLYLENPGVSFIDPETDEADAMLQNLFPDTTNPPDTAHCILQAKAYTCPEAPADPCANPDATPPRPLTNNEIYSLESELILFELSRAPTEILIPEYVVPIEGMTDTNNRIDLVWSTPEYTGAHDGHLYEIKWAQREDDEPETDFDASDFDDPDVAYADTICTAANGYSLDLPLNADSDTDSELRVDIRITPYATTQGAVAAAIPPNFTCPSSNARTAGELTDLHGIELVANGSVPVDDLPTLTIPGVPPSYDSVPTVLADRRTYLQNRFVNLHAEIALEVPKTPSYNLENYELRWSRADGTGTTNSRVINAPPPTDFIPPPPPTPPLPHERYSSPVILNLENNRAYNFTLTANFSNGETRTTSNCVVISHPERTPVPALDVIPAAVSLRVRITPLNQANLCNSPIIATPYYPSTQHYKVRAYTSVCASPGDYPNKQCATDNYNRCIPAGSAATEIIIPKLTAGISYEVEVIAGHNCNTSAKNISFDIPTPNPNNYGYPSVPVTKRAIPDADVTVPNNLVGIGVSYAEVSIDHDNDPDTPNEVIPDQKGSWIVSWEFPIADRAIGFILTVQHSASFDESMPKFVYVFPFSDTCTSVISPDRLSCSAEILDDDLMRGSYPPTPFTPLLQRVTTSGISPYGGTPKITNCRLSSPPPASLTNLSLPLGCIVDAI